MIPLNGSQIDDYADASGVPLLRADGFDACVVGVTDDGQKLVYSTRRIVETLCDRDGMTEDEALDFFCFNIQGAYLGPHTPVYLDDYSDGEP